MGKQFVNIKRLNWDVEFYKDLCTGNGFHIQEPSGVSIDGIKKKAMYGSMSPLYGTTYEDEQSFIERYRCDCGEFKSRLFEGEECPICHTKVRYKSSNINVTGWISIGLEKVINPYYYALLQKVIGKKPFDEIINAKNKVTTDGQRSSISSNDVDIVPASPYSFIGIEKFFENYEEIINYFKSKKKNYAHAFDNLIKEKRQVFTSHFPIYSTMLRPQSSTSDTFYFSSIDKNINTLYSLSTQLKKCEEIEKEGILGKIQIRLNKMWASNLDMINGKEGWIRDQLLGGSINYSSRNVIIPDPSLHDNEVDISYNTFLELYKYKIIRYIMELDNTTLSRAYNEWKNAAKFNEKVYKIMMHLVEKEQPRLLINRNPTLNYYSMLLMKPRIIKPTDNDYTLSVPLSILPGLNADFDGDILNIIGLMDKSLVFMFRKFDPVMRMIISRDTGLINDYFSITKGQLIDLYAFATYDGEADCNTPETFPDTETEQKSGFNLVRDIPIIHNEKEMRMWLKNLYIIEDYMDSYESYNDFRTRIYNVLKGCYVIDKCRNAPIRFKFTKNDKETYELPFRMFIINTILWYPFIELHGLDALTKEFILSDPEQLPDVENYINEYLVTVLKDYHIDAAQMNYSISEVLYNLRNISGDYSLILGLDFSIPMFINLYEQNPEIKDIMEHTFPETAQPHDIEQKLSSLEKRFVEIIKSMKNNPLGLALRAKTGIKHKQLAEFAISEGLKPDLTGQTIPIPIQNSTLIRGADKPSTQYIDATAARKSLVMNKKVMGKAGHFGKITLMTSRTLSMSQKVSDCGSKHLVAYDVRDKAVLKKLVGKYYRLNKDSDEELRFVTAKDRHLIGKTIYVRSAATCALGNHVCAKCVGKTAITNMDISDGISAFESEEVTKVINQNILSAKHLLTTNSEEVKFNSDFYKFFSIIGGEIYPKIDNNEDVPNIEDYAIYINPEDMAKIEEFDADTLYNTMIENGRFYIRNIVDPEKPDITIQIDGEKEIYITEDILAHLKSGNNLIKFSELDDGDKLFEVVILNNELTKPLYSLMQLLNKESKEELTIDEISNRFLSLVIEAKISASAIACELIINRLIRSAEDIYRRPDFSKDVLEPYQIIPVQKSLEKNESPLIGLAFQNIKRQLLSEELFENRHATSYVDSFFKTAISTENFKKYSEYAKNMKPTGGYK